MFLKIYIYKPEKFTVTPWGRKWNQEVVKFLGRKGVEIKNMGLSCLCQPGARKTASSLAHNDGARPWSATDIYLPRCLHNRTKMCELVIGAWGVKAHTQEHDTASNGSKQRPMSSTVFSGFTLQPYISRSQVIAKSKVEPWQALAEV